jgi:hypothetical protein
MNPVYILLLRIFKISIAAILPLTIFSQSKPAPATQTQKDLVDIVYCIIKKDSAGRSNKQQMDGRKYIWSVGPILEYTVSTGLTLGMAASISFFTDGEPATKSSQILGAVKYTLKNQFLFPVQSSVWTANNRYNFIGDWHYINFPQDTYGFGGYTALSDGYIVTYRSIRVYEFALKKISPNFFVGPGIQLDYHWNIQQINPPPGKPTDYDIYGFSGRSMSSGIGLNILYDSRKSSVNPEGGSFFGNIRFSQNMTVLGSNSNWNSVLIDVRKYVALPGNNILGFWSYNVFTLSGHPPYLDLPGTGSDTYNNTGRGYIYDRFIGKNMMDLEAEFRYHITQNGLIGGVLFANAETLSELYSNRFEVISPAVGIGLRVKFNKYSNTNVCVDYAIGLHGSRGFYGNLGEVF